MIIAGTRFPFKIGLNCELMAWIDEGFFDASSAEAAKYVD